MLNQREEKTGAELSNHGACNLVKWSDFFPVCGKIVVKRKITAKLAVIFLKNGGPEKSLNEHVLRRILQIVNDRCIQWNAYCVFVPGKAEYNFQIIIVDIHRNEECVK